MIWTLLLAIIIGILCGIVTGLTPGIHINLISVLIVSMSSILLEYTSALFLATIIISMGVTHTFLDSIPSIFLGAPDTDTVMAVLPGHKLLFQGLGWDAVRLTVIGSLLCLILCIAIIPLLALVFPILYNLMKNYIGYLLIVMVGFIILKDSKRIWAIVIFIFSGILGLIVLNSDISQPLFPMLSGMFGISALLISLFQKVEVPTQIATEYIKIGKGEYMQSLVGGVFPGSFVALFPGIGAAQAAAMSTVFFKVKEYGYLILVGGINTVNFIIALVTVYTLDKARNGAIVAVMEIITNIDLARLITFAAIALIVGGIATILTLKIAKLFAFMIEEINYNMISGFILLFIIGLAFYFSGFIGLLVLFISTALGIIPQITGACRSNAMGCLLLPVITFYVL
ncbi:tripartite tricarboxylate transporter permease [Candidatus Woesearchaeota archaeon]|nr:tripartite tricarboxylate transporter permease [Candidatus Woesearchaeota archaeon]